MYPSSLPAPLTHSLALLLFQTGYLVPAGDEEAMAAKVNELLDDKALRLSMSKAGREETEKWSWEAATSVLRNVQYQKVRGSAAPFSLEFVRSVSAVSLRAHFAQSSKAPIDKHLTRGMELGLPGSSGAPPPSLFQSTTSIHALLKRQAFTYPPPLRLFLDLFICLF